MSVPPSSNRPPPGGAPAAAPPPVYDDAGVSRWCALHSDVGEVMGASRTDAKLGSVGCVDADGDQNGAETGGVGVGTDVPDVDTGADTGAGALAAANDVDGGTGDTCVDGGGASPAACARSSLIPFARWKRRPNATMSISFSRLMSIASSASPLISCSASLSMVCWS